MRNTLSYAKPPEIVSWLRAGRVCRQAGHQLGNQVRRAAHRQRVDFARGDVRARLGRGHRRRRDAFDQHRFSETAATASIASTDAVAPSGSSALSSTGAEAVLRDANRVGPGRQTRHRIDAVHVGDDGSFTLQRRRCHDDRGIGNRDAVGRLHRAGERSGLDALRDIAAAGTSASTTNKPRSLRFMWSPSRIGTRVTRNPASLSRMGATTRAERLSR